MRYGRRDRAAIRQLSCGTKKLFDLLEHREQGEFVSVPELCQALAACPTFAAFACLAGDGTTRTLEQNLGFLSSRRKCETVASTLECIRTIHKSTRLIVIVDDYEPTRAWQWDVPQKDVTEWCELLARIEFSDVLKQLGADISLCSELESGFEPTYEHVLPLIRNGSYEMLIHANLRHIQRFPSKKRVGDGRASTVRKVAQYAVQGLVLESLIPNAILLQSETPWAVKDPLFNSLRKNPLPIVHLFPDERR